MFENRCEHRWTRGISADADHHIGSELSEHSSSRKHGAGEVESRFQPSCETNAVQGPHFYQLQRKASRWNEAVLDPTRGADEKHFSAEPLTDFLGNADSRD